MENLKKAADSFRAAHPNLFTPGRPYAIGYGMDPARKGPLGIHVIALSNDVREQDSMVHVAKEKSPSAWEGFPVYVLARALP